MLPIPAQEPFLWAEQPPVERGLDVYLLGTGETTGASLTHFSLRFLTEFRVLSSSKAGSRPQQKVLRATSTRGAPRQGSWARDAHSEAGELHGQSPAPAGCVPSGPAPGEIRALHGSASTPMPAGHHPLSLTPCNTHSTVKARRYSHPGPGTSKQPPVLTLAGAAVGR